MSSASSIKSSRHEKKKEKVLPVSQKAIDYFIDCYAAVLPTLNDFQAELKTLKQYTRTLPVVLR